MLLSEMCSKAYMNKDMRPQKLLSDSLCEQPKQHCRPTSSLNFLMSLGA